jgi:hypothetical protein
MKNETGDNEAQKDSAVIHVSFKARKTISTSGDHTPEEIYALFAPRFGTAFTEWFIEQYKKLDA